MINECRIQIFVVFHHTLFDECYQHIPDDILTTYFTFFAVNDEIVKTYTPNKYKVVNEWELPIYDPLFQKRGYNENSAIYHVHANKLHQNYDYIGFFQYDTIFKDNLIEFLQNQLANTDIPMYFPLEIYNFQFCAFQTWGEVNTIQFITNDYEEFFNTKFSTTEIYPLMNSFILPAKTYEKIMQWIVQLYDKLYPWCIEPPNCTGHGHLGGIYERIMAFVIGNEKLPHQHINVKHDHHYKRLCNESMQTLTVTVGQLHS